MGITVHQQAFYPMTLLACLALGQSSGWAQQTAPHGNAAGVNNGSQTTNNYARPEPRACRISSNGIEFYQTHVQKTLVSPEMGGGHSQPEWCNTAKAQLQGDFKNANFTVAGSSEISRNHCSPFNCPQYTYTCVINVEADPVYKEKISSDCPGG
jgi:hypothetical protein